MMGQQGDYLHNKLFQARNGLRKQFSYVKRDSESRFLGTLQRWMFLPE